MKLCHGIFGLLFGHKFEARNDEDHGEGKWPFKPESTESQVASTNSVFLEDIISQTAPMKLTYVKDICVRCGEEIKR